MPYEVKHHALVQNPVMYTTKEFTYDKSTDTFIAEASDLPIFHHAKVYTDACDVGFILASSKTGNERLVTLVDTMRDAEGDVQCWTYASIPVGDEKSFTVLIFND